MFFPVSSTQEGAMLMTMMMACSEPVTTEPLDLPADQAEAGVPVGVRTVVSEDVTFEVWYPAAEAEATADSEGADFLQFIPQVFIDTVGEVSLPSGDTGTYRDAVVRDTGEPLPVVLFSHGFGGFRLQSHALTSHLASRGYVVIAPDHPGRMMGDVLPCLFSPPLEGCDLTGFFEDPALEDLDVALSWAESGPDWLSLDLDTVGLTGHSAGGNSTTAFGADPRIGALLPMAGGGTVKRDVPTLFIDGTCDGIVTPDSTQASADASAAADIAHLAGAGHLAFTDLCSLDMIGLAEELLADRDDLNPAFYDQLLALASDGCPEVAPTVDSPDCAEDYLDAEIAEEILRYGMTAFFDQHLRGEGTVSFEAYPSVY